MSSVNNSLINFINRQLDGKIIRQRTVDGYICATDMCKIVNKKFNHYYENKTTKEYLNELSCDTGKSVSQLVEINKGNSKKYIDGQGTWIHPKIGIHLAHWLSPKFAIKVTDWVCRYLAGDLTLAAEIVSNHDNINNTTSTVTINTVDNRITEFEMKERELALFERETAFQTNDLELKKAKVAFELDFLSKIEKLSDDPALYSAIKDRFITSYDPNNNLLTYPITSSYCPDFSEIIQDELRRSIPPSNLLTKLGTHIAKKYRKEFKTNPDKNKKHVNGAARNVNVYPLDKKDWLIDNIRSFFDAYTADSE